MRQPEVRSLSLTFDINVVFSDLWLSSNFVSGVSLCDSSTQSLFSVLFALSVCFSILRCGQTGDIKWDLN